MVAERGDEERDLVGRRRHVGIGEEHEVALGGEHPRPDRGALAAVRHAQHMQPDAGHGAAGLRAALDLGDRVVRAAVVDDQDIDRVGQRCGAGRAIAAVLIAPRR